MSNFGSPAHGAAMGNAAGMAVIAAGVVGLASALGDGLRAAREETELDAYSDALHRATVHSRQMQIVAEAAIAKVRSLEAQVASLTAACAQRHDVIQLLMGRA